MWAMILEYQNYEGAFITHHLPLFNSAAECQWWIKYLWGLLELNGAHDATKAVCEFHASASLS